MNNQTNDKKRIGLITSYYLSRCDMRAVKALGYKNFTEAFNGIGDLINENPNNIKNMRDEFDPYFPNARRGWYQRPLRASRQEVFDELAAYSDAQVEQLVKQLLGLAKSGVSMENVDVLRDLGKLIRESTIHYNQDFVWQDVELTTEFKDAYAEYLDKNRWSIEYFNATSVITSPSTKNIFVPNQWFVIASYAVGVYSELTRYKEYLLKVSDKRHKKLQNYAKQLRDDTASVDKMLFLDTGKHILLETCHEDKQAEKAAKRLWRFATDYSWWSGQKTIDRGDFHMSVVLNMLNLVNASQGYVGDIVNAYGSDDHLRNITRRLDSFTTNMEGVTYDILLSPSEDDRIEEAFPVTNIEVNKTHRISISAESLRKIGGK